jgi:hypothetical protein
MANDCVLDVFTLLYFFSFLFFFFFNKATCFLASFAFAVQLDSECIMRRQVATRMAQVGHAC